jgi:hypothetical protein
MPALDYRFIQQYGFEQYNAANGKTPVTGDNLVISSWFATIAGDPAGPLSFAAQILPDYANTAVGASERAASVQSVKSRHSARYLFVRIGQAPVPGQQFCLVLNPPPEYKQQMQGAIVYNGGDPYDIASYTVKKPLQANYLWEAQQDVTSGGQNNIATDGFSVTFGAYPPNTSAFFAGTPMQLLKTNGADGVAPVFFDFSSPSGVKAMIDAVNAGGEYYIPLYFTFGSSTPEGAYRTVKYPHSIARG